MFNDDVRKKDVKTPTIVQEVWHNGEFIKWDDARVHVMSHVLHYGSSVFEGIRCYKTRRGPAVFRLREHMQRFLNSAKIYRMEHAWTLEELSDASVQLVARSGIKQCYIRPIMFRSLDEERPAFGVNPFPNPMACYIGAWDWGKYLGDEAIEQGVDVCVSSWNRLTPNSMPAMAKAGANYMNSQLIKMEAITNGYAEGIALDDRGYVSEGSGENIFLVHEGKVVTPPLASSILPGITRDSVIEICRALEIGRQREPRPRHRAHPARLLRDHFGRARGSGRVAHLRGRAQARRREQRPRPRAGARREQGRGQRLFRRLIRRRAGVRPRHRDRVASAAATHEARAPAGVSGRAPASSFPSKKTKC